MNTHIYSIRIHAQTSKVRGCGYAFDDVKIYIYGLKERATFHFLSINLRKTTLAGKHVEEKFFIHDDELIFTIGSWSFGRDYQQEILENIFLCGTYNLWVNKRLSK